MSIPVFLSLGSNLGDRQKNLEDALVLLEAAGARIAKRSAVYETPPWGKTDQPAFLPAGNASFQIWLIDQALLKKLLSLMNIVVVV